MFTPQECEYHMIMQNTVDLRLVPDHVLVSHIQDDGLLVRIKKGDQLMPAAEIDEDVAPVSADCNGRIAHPLYLSLWTYGDIPEFIQVNEYIQPFKQVDREFYHLTVLNVPDLISVGLQALEKGDSYYEDVIAVNCTGRSVNVFLRDKVLRDILYVHHTGRIEIEPTATIIQLSEAMRVMKKALEN